MGEGAAKPRGGTAGRTFFWGGGGLRRSLVRLFAFLLCVCFPSVAQRLSKKRKPFSHLVCPYEVCQTPQSLYVDQLAHVASKDGACLQGVH